MVCVRLIALLIDCLGFLQSLIYDRCLSCIHFFSMVDYSFPDVINISIHFIMKLKKKNRKKKQSGRHEICRLQRMLQKRYGEYNQAIPDFFFSKSNL